MAGMQPYFFPYLGYWQLIAAVDCFVLFDESQYIKQGWVNRNRVLRQGGGWQYVQVPVARHPMDASIHDVAIAPGSDWKRRVFNQLAHYKTVASHFGETMALVEACIPGGHEQSIGALNCRTVRTVCEALAIRTEIVVSSEHPFDYAGVAAPGDWALAHAQQLGAGEIVNPRDGIPLLDIGKLASHGIRVSALSPPAVAYAQGGRPFEPALSIIDVLMFNGIEGTRRLLEERTVQAVHEPLEVGV